MTDRPVPGKESRRSDAMRRADMANGEGRPEDERRLLKVLIAVDRSDTAVGIAVCARDTFGRGAQYLVMNVGQRDVDMYGAGPMPFGVPYPVADSYFDSTAQAAVHDPDHPTVVDKAEAEARSVTTSAGLPPDTEARGAAGDPVEQILEVAQAESIDIIVVGAGGGGWWHHLLDPSVSRAVLRRADRPVLVVP